VLVYKLRGLRALMVKWRTESRADRGQYASHHALRELEFATDPLYPVGEEVTADEDEEDADQEECNIHVCPSCDANPT
jgi:hypothetical protein